MLKNDFILGWKNIIAEKFVGESHGYDTEEDSSVGTTNGAGPHNVQFFVIAPDGTVIHALPGFWHPDDLAWELNFAKQLYAVWTDKSLSLAKKQEKCKALQLDAIAKMPTAMTARSSWQGFDAKAEEKRRDAGVARDTFSTEANAMGKSKMKPINQLVHERMAQRPFVAFAKFDTPQYCDYGRLYYDNNKKVDGEGETFMTPRKLEKQQEREQRQKQMRDRIRGLFQPNNNGKAANSGNANSNSGKPAANGSCPQSSGSCPPGSN